MILKFLGTGTSGGVPSLGCHCHVCQSKDTRDERLRSSVWLQIDGTALLIDAGPDFRTQALHQHISNIDAVLLTHFHKDHIAGLDDLKPFCFLNKKSLPLFANDSTLDAIKNDFSYALKDFSTQGVPHFSLQKIDEQQFIFNGISIQPIPVLHYQLPIMGFRIKNMAYITDAKIIPETSYQLLHDLDVLIINALRIQPHFSHFSLAEALNAINIIQPKVAYLTHIGHQMGLYQTIENQLPDSVHLAYDGLTIEI
ncbi:MAG: MBL fold metallo-hydrolase [Bacteroidales bacterium]|nr:MBL fold metallo-hydrolase [Bacteroidales bacterium]